MRDLVLITSFVIMLGPAFSMPHVGVLVWTWVALMNPHRLSFGFTRGLQLNLIIAVITLLAWILSRERVRIPMTATTGLMIVFTIWMIVTTFTGLDVEYSQEYLIRNLKTMAMAFAVMGLINNRARIHALVWTLVIALGFFGVKGGLFTAITAGNYRFWGPPKSMIYDNNHLAVALLMLVPLIFYLRGHSASKLVRRGLAGVIFVTLIAIIGTYSRGAMVALAGTLGAFWFRSRHKFVGMVAIFFLGIGVVAFMPDKFIDRAQTIETAEQDSSFQGRLEAWQTGYNIASKRPLVGAGFRAYEKGAIAHRFNPDLSTAFGRAMHSIYFQVLADMGWVGLILFLAILFTVWRNIRFVVHRTRGIAELAWAHDLARMLEISFVAYGIGGAALSLAFYDGTYVLVALSVALRILVTEHLKAQAAPSPAVPAAGQRLVPTH